MEWLLDIWNAAKSTFNLIGSNLNNLITSMDNQQFGDNVISNVLANIHYIVGTPIYLAFILLIQLGIAFMIWSCARAILSLINSFTPKIRGKIGF